MQEKVLHVSVVLYTIGSRHTTEPHNHRVAEVSRDLWRSPGPTLLLKQGHLEPAAQDNVQGNGPCSIAPSWYHLLWALGFGYSSA